MPVHINVHGFAGSMMTTKTKALYTHHQTEQAGQRECELAAVAVNEFPLGSKVKWIRTYDRDGNPQWLHGGVKEQGLDRQFSWTMKTASGALHKRYPWELEHDVAEARKESANA